MAALVQTIPQQSVPVPVLQPRPSSSGALTPSSQSTQQQNYRNSAMSWNSYNSVGNSGNYRVGHPVVAPYAFSSTPNLSNSANMQNRQSWSPHLRPEHRSSSAPSVSQGSPSSNYVGVNNTRFVHHPAAGSVSTTSSNSSLQSYISKDDSAIPSRQLRGDPFPRPLSTINLPSPSSTPFMNISSPTASRPSPDRYRRGNRRADNAAGAQPTATAPNLPGDDHFAPKGTARDIPRTQGHTRVSSADDMSRTEKPQAEIAKRYRRRSWGNIDNAGLINLQLHLPASSPTILSHSHDYFDPIPRPRSAQSQRDGSGSIHSARSSTSSVREAGSVDPVPSNKGVNKPDDTKRVTKPSPLSQPISVDAVPEAPRPSTKEKPVVPTESVATQRLTEITKNDANRPPKSRLRRAFSFGSASELLKASTQSNASKRETLIVDKARRELLKEELGPEQAAIAEQQEAGGLDNLSVSSTASSASIMLRKMGKGMKRSTRSLVGLFRPKSIVNVSSMEAATVEPMAPQLSVVNVEADKKGVAVKSPPQELPRGDPVPPKVESNTTDTSGHEDGVAERSQSRKSIVGGDRERAEVLAAVRKGILKKTNSDSAIPSASSRPSESVQAQNGSDSPRSSAPSTPEDRSRSGARRSDAVKIAGEDYFLPDGRFAESKSAPVSPQPVAKSLVFSPRIQFHETWPSGEYDRRGEIATCNRLTPLLAQQIKEELNNFKMEMEVHETSKIYTHFL